MDVKFRRLMATVLLVTLPAHALANDTMIEIEPGQYAYSQSMVMNGQSMLNHDYETCLSAQDTPKTMKDLVENFEKLRGCQMSDIAMGDAHGEANFTCAVKDMGLKFTGTITADYTSTDFKVVTDGQIGGTIRARATVNARRIGDCP